MSVHIDSDGGVCLSVCHILKQKEGRDGDRERQRERQRRKYWDGKEQFIYITVCQNVIMAKKRKIIRFKQT